MRFSLFLFLGLFSLASAWAQSPWSDSCGCQTCGTPPTTTQALTDLTPLSELTALNSAQQKMSRQIEQQVEQFGDFFRWVKGDRPKGSALGFPERWQRTVSEAQGLMELCQARGIKRRQFDACLFNCSPVRKMELQDQKAALDKMQLTLLGQAPWLMHDQFMDECAKAEKDENFSYRLSEATIKEAFISSMAKFFTDLFALRGKLAEFELASQAHKTLPSTWNPLLYEKHDLAIETLLHSALPEELALCGLAEKKYRWNKLKDRASLVADVSLVTLSILMGPESLLAMGAREAGVSWFARFGKNITTRLAGFVPDLALASKFILEHEQLSRECQRAVTRTSLGLSTSAQWLACQNEKEAAALKIGLQALASSSGLAFNWLNKLPVLWQQASRPIAFAARAEGGGKQLNYLDLSQSKELKKLGLETVSRDYWGFVGEIYRKRLNLTDQEIKGFIESSRQYEARTKLITQTRGPPGKSTQFEGGVAVVESTKPTDLLPLEKATGVRLPREQGRITEIVRLTSVSEDNPLLMRDLLKEVGTLLREAPDTKKVYVYTSKVHARLYKKLGIEAKITPLPEGRDVLIEIDPQAFIQAVHR